LSAPNPPGAPAEAGGVHGRRPDRALRLIAAYKFCKAALLVAIGLGSLRLLNPDVEEWADRWAAALALRHDRRLLAQLVTLVSDLSPRSLQALALGAFAVALLFITEGVGLWVGKRWAEYLTVIATTLFVPVEIFELARRITAPRVAALLINLVVVAFLAYRLRRSESPRPA
jgi:uncharacterized membrane protein (DUF2068 family)